MENNPIIEVMGPNEELRKNGSFLQLIIILVTKGFHIMCGSQILGALESCDGLHMKHEVWNKKL